MRRSVRRGVLCIALALLLSACGDAPAQSKAGPRQSPTPMDVIAAAGQLEAPPPAEPQPTQSGTDDPVDIDLTELGSNLVYAEVYGMMISPKDYLGKTVKMRGEFAVYEGAGRNYYACIISDATACCAQGIEFVLDGSHCYPDDYPPPGTEITVSGTFDSYVEQDVTYAQLIDAKLL